VSELRAVRFGGEYDVVAPLYTIAPGVLRARDLRHGGSLQRWYATDGREAVAAVDARLRPDDRVFLRFAGDWASYGILSEAARTELARPLYATVDGMDATTLRALEAAGFQHGHTTEIFRIRFDDALRSLRRSWLPTWARIVSAGDAERDRLLELDNDVRCDVPGTDGWQGNRAWFDDELAESPPFDPKGYLVAEDLRNGHYAGLFRIWRNESGPRLGLVGTRRPYRPTTIAGALLRAALVAASTWGSDVFETEASVSNPVTYQRAAALATERFGRRHQMVLPA
jgi:hypothetical protein